MRTLVLAAALSLTAAGCSKPDKAVSAPAAGEEAKLRAMTLDEVERALAANQVVAVDCNGDATRKKLGVVPGAILVSDDESYAASELPADKATKLVFYCADPG
jgi:rhodanese-related sulfurtransferase